MMVSDANPNVSSLLRLPGVSLAVEGFGTEKEVGKRNVTSGIVTEHAWRSSNVGCTGSNLDKAELECTKTTVGSQNGRRLTNLVATAVQSQQFFEKLDTMRERSAEESKDREPVPVFNKRLFSAHGSVVITPEARRLMARNARVRPDEEFVLFTKSELHAMRCVVNGLRLIHRGHDYVKDVLSHVITLESYSAHQYIVKRPHENQLSCYYIIHGAVQVTYDMDVAETRNVFQPDVIYNHGAGEFLGLVSPDGLSDDLSPPATVYTIEPCELLRIDRKRFHTVVEKIGEFQHKEKMAFFSKPGNALSSLPPDAMNKVIAHVHKMEFPPNRIIIQQGDRSEHLFFVLSGRCSLSRDVFIPEIGRDVRFYLDSREADDFFAEECLLDDVTNSLCHVTTTSHTVFFLLHRAALEVVSKELLLHVLKSKQHYLPPDEELRERGYQKSVWDGYKHHEIRETLRERDCLHLLSYDEPERVQMRPLSADFQRKENLFRFVMKGANFKPVDGRVHSAFSRSSTYHDKKRIRPHTAVGIVQTTNCTRQVQVRPTVPLSLTPGDRIEDKDAKGNKDSSTDTTTGDVIQSVDNSLTGSQLTSSFMLMLEKNLPKSVLQKIIGIKGSEIDQHVLTKAIEDHPDLARQLRLAWEVYQQDIHDGFTKTTVLVTMKIDDIVRKAKALAIKQTFAAAEADENESAEWNTSIHEENKTAKTHIAANKLRTAFLRKKINILQRKQEKVHEERMYRSAKPGHVPQSEKQKAESQKKFYLDEIERKYQGLDPKDAQRKSFGSYDHHHSMLEFLCCPTSPRPKDTCHASDKVNSLGYEVLFVTRLSRPRSRSLHDIEDMAERNTKTNNSSRQYLMPQDQKSIRRKSLEERKAHPLTRHRIVALQKDAPITLRSSTLTNYGEACGSSSSTRQQFSRDLARTNENNKIKYKSNLPFPKLQKNTYEV